MKYYSRLGIYKANNVKFNPTTLEAYSYGWWRFVEKIGNKIVFNDYGYSNTTARHQSKVRALLDSLDIHIDYRIKAPMGLQDLSIAIRDYEYDIGQLENAMNKKGSKAFKNKERKADIAALRKQIKVVERLIKMKAKE